MDEEAILEIKARFAYKENLGDKTVTFYNDHILIKMDADSKKIKYADIERLKYNSNTIKIFTKEDEKLKIPCYGSDIKKIRTLFRAKDDIIAREVIASALVILGEMNFIVPIRSTDIKGLKTTIIRRIAKHFYPACENNGVNLELFQKLVFFTVLDENKLIPLLDNQDLDAALLFFENRLRIKVEFKEQ